MSGREARLVCEGGLHDKAVARRGSEDDEGGWWRAGGVVLA